MYAISYRYWGLARAGLMLVVFAWLDMSEAACAAQASGGHDVLREIADNVRANELLYRDIELELRWTYDLREPAGGANETMMKRIDAEIRCVLQDGLLYFKIDGTGEGVDGERLSADAEQAFDGEYTRVYERRAFANIRHGRSQDARVPRPHTLILRLGQLAIPLSAQLLATEYNQRSAFRVEYTGDEEIDGLNCVKLRTELWPKDEPQPPLEQREHWDVWLATDRNYLPTKMVAYVPGYGANVPIQTGAASDFREIAPGVWFPFHVTVTVFNELELRHDRAVVSNVIDYAFSTAALDPSYPKSLFSSVRFPKGTPVYEVQDGKIIRSWVEGEQGKLTSAGPVKRYWLVAFNVAVGTLLAGWAVGSFWRARRGHAR